MLPAIIAGAQGLYGLYRGIKAQQGLDALNKQRQARFMDAANPLIQNRALQEKQYRQGLTPASKALANQNFAMSQLSNQRAANDMSGGQMSNALSRMAGVNNANFALSLAAQNEAAQRQGMQGMIGTNRELSGLQQRDIGVDINQRQEMLKGYGLAKQQGFQDALGAASGFAMMNMKLSEAQKDRDLYAKVNGVDNDAGSTAKNTDASTTANNSPYTFGGSFGNLNMPKIAKSIAYNLPLSMGGSQRLNFNRTNPNNLPPTMGGTNVDLAGEFNDYEETSPNLLNLPYSMGGKKGIGSMFKQY